MKPLRILASNFFHFSDLKIMLSFGIKNYINVSLNTARICLLYRTTFLEVSQIILRFTIGH